MTEVVLGAQPTGNPGEQGNPAAAQPNAATTDPHTDDGEGGEQSGTPKTFSQHELDEIVKRRVAKAEDRAERRVLRTLEKLQPQQSAPQQHSQPGNDGKPTRAQFHGNDEAYVEALTDWKLEQRDRATKANQHQQQQQSTQQKTDAIYAQAQKLPGFDREAFDELPLTKPMVEALVDADEATAAKLMHHMASHPEDVERIGKLSPARQAAEIGKLEAALPATRKTSNAPDPIDPVRGGRTSAVGDLSKLPMEQYIEQRKKQGARWAQNR